MSASNSLQLVRFSKAFDRTSFSSGDAEIDNWLQLYARQQEESGTSRTYFLAHPGSTEILGYLAMGVGHYFPSKESDSKDARYGLRMLEIFRLGVRADLQGRGLASIMMRDAFRIALEVSDLVGVQGVVVQPASETLINFYRRFGFHEFREIPPSLAISIKTIRNAAKVVVLTKYARKGNHEHQV